MCLEVARNEFHRCYTTGADLGHEAFMRRESGFGSPEAEPRGVTKISDLRRAGGGGVKHAGARQMVLQPQARHPLLGALDLAARARRPKRIGHGMGLVEGNHASELFARPGKDLVEARVFGPARAQCRIGDEQNAFGQRYGSPELPAREGLDIERQSAKCFPVAACIFQQRLVLGDPDMPTFAREPTVHHHSRNLPPLARSGPIAKEEALPIGVAVFGQLEHRAFLTRSESGR